MSWGPFDLLRPLFDFCICLAKFAVGLLLAGAMALVNLLVAGLMAVVGFVLSLLPTIQFPSFQAPDWAAWLNWLFPIDHLLVAIVLIAGFLIVWHVVQIGLRWAKAIE